MIKVLLVDDHPVVLEGLRTMLATAPDIEVVAEAGDGLEALERVNKHKPDMVLMDLRMPNLDGVEAIRRIKSQFPSTLVIVLTMYENDTYAVDAVKAGADGYLLKDASRDLLIHAIRAVNSGGMLIKAGVLREAFLTAADRTSAPLKEKSAGSTTPGELTLREMDVLRLVVQGRSNKEIGEALCISEDTAKKHLQTIMLKMGVSDRTQAAVKALHAGLVDYCPDKET